MEEVPVIVPLPAPTPGPLPPNDNNAGPSPPIPPQEDLEETPVEQGQEPALLKVTGPRGRTIYDKRSDRFVEIDDGKSEGDYWGHSQWHSHGLPKRMPPAGPQCMSEVLEGADWARPLYAVLRETPKQGPYVQLMYGRLERLARLWASQSLVHSKAEDDTARERRAQVERLIDSVTLSQEDELVASLTNGIWRGSDAYSRSKRGEVTWQHNVPSADASGTNKCGPAIYVLTRTHGEIQALIDRLSVTLQYSNPMFAHNLANGDYAFLNGFFDSNLYDAKAASAGPPDCHGYRQPGVFHRYATGRGPQSHVLRAYYPDDSSGGLLEPAQAWSTKRGAPQPDDPVRNAGISGNHFLCCGQLRDHPGCFVDTYSTTTNQPKRYKIAKASLWGPPFEYDVGGIKDAWLKSTRRGTAWLSKTTWTNGRSYDAIHNRIEELKRQVADGLSRAYALAPTAKGFFVAMGSPMLNKLVKMLRLEAEYNSYHCHAGPDSLPSDAAGWLEYIGHALGLDRPVMPSQYGYQSLLNIVRRTEELHVPLVNHYSPVFSLDLVAVLEGLSDAADIPFETSTKSQSKEQQQQPVSTLESNIRVMTQLTVENTLEARAKDGEFVADVENQLHVTLDLSLYEAIAAVYETAIRFAVRFDKETPNVLGGRVAFIGAVNAALASAPNVSYILRAQTAALGNAVDNTAILEAARELADELRKLLDGLRLPMDEFIEHEGAAPPPQITRERYDNLVTVLYERAAALTALKPGQKIDLLEQYRDNDKGLIAKIKADRDATAAAAAAAAAAKTVPLPEVELPEIPLAEEQSETEVEAEPTDSAKVRDALNGRYAALVDVLDSMHELDIYITAFRNDLRTGNDGIKYWQKGPDGNESPNIVQIESDIQSVILPLLGAVPTGASDGSIQIPPESALEQGTFMSALTPAQFKTGFGRLTTPKVEGASRATKTGFAISRVGGTYVTQLIAHYTPEKGPRPGKTNRSILVPVGISGKVRDWAALALFLRRYSYFVNVLVRNLINNDKQTSSPISTKRWSSKIMSIPTRDIAFLEEWMNAPENFAVLMSPDQTQGVKEHIGMDIGETEPSGDWDSEATDAPLTNEPIQLPQLGDTEWTVDEWE
jgi:hypothetical protein